MPSFLDFQHYFVTTIDCDAYRIASHNITCNYRLFAILIVTLLQKINDLFCSDDHVKKGLLNYRKVKSAIEKFYLRHF